MFLPGYRIADRLDLSVYDSLDADPSGPAIDVELEMDRPEDRLVDAVDDGREHVEDGRAGLRLLAGQDREDRAALRLVGTLVDHHEGFAAALMDRLGPGEHPGPGETVERNFAEMAFVDAHRRHRAAMAVCGKRIELAGTSPVAVAIGYFRAAHPPIDKSHGRFSSLRRRQLTVSVPIMNRL